MDGKTIDTILEGIRVCPTSDQTLRVALYEVVSRYDVDLRGMDFSKNPEFKGRRNHITYEDVESVLKRVSFDLSARATLDDYLNSKNAINMPGIPRNQMVLYALTQLTIQKFSESVKKVDKESVMTELNALLTSYRNSFRKVKGDFHAKYGDLMISEDEDKKKSETPVTSMEKSEVIRI